MRAPDLGPTPVYRSCLDLRAPDLRDGAPKENQTCKQLHLAACRLTSQTSDNGSAVESMIQGSASYDSPFASCFRSAHYAVPPAWMIPLPTKAKSTAAVAFLGSSLKPASHGNSHKQESSSPCNSRIRSRRNLKIIEAGVGPHSDQAKCKAGTGNTAHHNRTTT